MKLIFNKGNFTRLFLAKNWILAGIIFAFIGLFSFQGYSQSWSMPVDGKVYQGKDKLSGSIITLYRNGQQLQQVVTTSNGRFSFDLPANAEYLISITKPGFITKKFKINTANVPADRGEAGGFNPFEPDVTLFEMPSAPEISKRVEAILSQPIAVYQYIPSEKNFNYDESYTNAIQAKLSELAQLQKQAEKEALDKAKNAALEAEKQLAIDKNYKAAIAKADAAMNSKDYTTAKGSYTEALDIKPGEAYPKSKLAEIQKLIADAGKQKELDAKYDAAISKADAAFNAKDYNAAKAGYTEASALKSSEAYPKTKLAEVNKILADVNKQKEVDTKYQAAIAKADGLFTAKDYTNAKATYTEASGIKPTEQYPKTKLAEIESLLAGANKQKEIDAKYQSAITKGDNAFNSKDYPVAKVAFTEAAGLKPTEQYPKTKLAEIDKLITADLVNKEKEEQYKNAIAKGDATFEKKEYAGAKTSYTEATNLKPSETYPKSKIALIDKILADLSKAGESEKQYNDLIAKADNLFSQKDYTSAKSAYSDASAIKSAEQYPKTKIIEIDKLLADLDKQKSAAEKEQQYKDALAKADKSFTAKEYEDAKSNYNQALSIKPAEQYPKTKLAEIDKILASAGKQKEIDAKYQAAITKGDNAFNVKNYVAAKTSFAEASALKNTETYPKTKIIEIDKLLADLDKQKSVAEKEQQYKEAIARADKQFTLKDYENSRGAYNEALSIKPTEQYPKTKITEIDNLLAALGKQNDIDAQYKLAISKADASFATKDYAAAKSSYSQASGIKPAEAYPKAKLAEIEKLLAQVANASAQHETNDKYLATIAKGDKAFNAKDYATAKPMYEEASRIKPTETYPKDKLAEIAELIKKNAEASEQKEIDNQYKEAIARGDKSFTQKDYNSSKLAYQDALTYKPTEKYPQDRIKAIEDILKKAIAAKNVKKQPEEKNVVTPVLAATEQKKAIQDELRSKYPAGVTQEEYTSNGKTVLRRVVIKEDFAGVYTKVTHNWGGIYCFRDNTPITEIVFENETK